jgi:hypothetical protein
MSPEDLHFIAGNHVPVAQFLSVAGSTLGCMPVDLSGDSIAMMLRAGATSRQNWAASTSTLTSFSARRAWSL